LALRTGKEQLGKIKAAIVARHKVIRVKRVAVRTRGTRLPVISVAVTARDEPSHKVAVSVITLN